MKYGVMKLSHANRFKRLDAGFLMTIVEVEPEVEKLVDKFDREKLEEIAEKIGYNTKAWDVVARGLTRYSQGFTKSYTSYDIALYILLAQKNNPLTQKAIAKPTTNATVPINKLYSLIISSPWKCLYPINPVKDQYVYG